MFRFANYVFGTEVESNSDNENIDLNECIEQDIDDDWILIDVPSDKHKKQINAEKSDDKDLPSIDANYETTTIRVPQTLNTSDAQQNDTELSDHYSDPLLDNIYYYSRNACEALEESWFMDPPPCFNSLTQPVMIETTPLENLLIEHPSMSVFGPSLPPIDHRSSHSDSSTLLPTDMSSNGSTAPQSRRQMRQIRREYQQQLIVRNTNDNQMNVNLHLRSGKT